MKQMNNLGGTIMDENINKEIDMGIVKISDDVVEVIAALAATEIKGIAGMNENLVGGLTHMLSGKKTLSKGVKVNVLENTSTIDLYVVVDYGVRIPEVAKQVQENVKKAVETMTGLSVSEVNLHVVNVKLPNEKTNVEEINE